MPRHEEYIESETVILTEIKTDDPRVASLMVQRSEKSNEPIVHARVSDMDGISTDWVVGEKYELQNIELKSRTGNDPGQYFSSCKKTSVKRLTYDSFDFLVVGDTHFGYVNREETHTRHVGRNGIDSRYRHTYEFEALNSIINLAKKWDIDAIFHTGDVFDHNITSHQYSAVERVFQYLGELDVNVFFVLGNHDKHAHDEISAINALPHVYRIDKKCNWGTTCGFNIIGQSYDDLVSLSDFEWSEFEHKYGGPNILLAHPEHTPSLEKSGFNRFTEVMNEKWIVFLGHRHEEESCKWGELQVIYTGFPAKLDHGGRILRVRGGRKVCSVSSYEI